jgi:probable 2-oxoglutarate dehydrogenase E1 component DHKTD1
MFQPVLLDPAYSQSDSNNQPERVIFCSGKIYYDLADRREKSQLADKIAIVRIEEIAPFPWKAIQKVLDTYMSQGEKTEVVWVQEEPENQGPWPHVKDRLNNLLSKRGEGVKFIGRKASAVPAVGVGKIARREKEEFMDKAFHI